MESDGPSYLFEWPESERIKKVLYVESPKFEHCYTMPGIKSSSPLEDPLAAAAEQMLRKTVVRPTVSFDVDGLKKLIAGGHLRAAINLTTKLLTDLGQGIGMAGHPSKNTFETFELWACRFQLLMALKLYALLNDELSPFEELDAPDLYLQYYPHLYKTCKGSLVPFSLRLVHAESLRFTPFPWAAIQRINVLEENVQKVIENQKEKGGPAECIKAWKQRLVAVQKTRARSLFFLKEYNLSMMLYNRICANEESEEKKLSLRLLLARIAAVVGDEKSLSRFLKEIPLVASKEKEVQLHREGAGSMCSWIFKAAVALLFEDKISLQTLAIGPCLVWECLKSVFYGQYSKALEFLKSTVMQPDDPKVWNNAAVCTLYSGRVNEALKIFEKFFELPNEPLLLNFISINELTARDVKQKKLSIFEDNLEKLPDLVDPAVLKLSP